jgi:hypothetical protein
MATTKRTPRTTADKTTKKRPTNDASHDAVAAESPASAEPIPVKTTPVANDPTAETTTSDTPRAADEPTREYVSARPNQPVEHKPLSAVEAAAKVLAESGQAMSCKELIAAMAAKGYWSSPRGRTPAATLYSALLRELQTKGEQARFIKTQRGKFSLRRAL